MDWFAILWFILMVIFVMTEATTVTMVSIWFVFGALAAMIVAFLGGQLWLQVTVFVAVSAVLLASLRPLARKYWVPKLVKTNVDSVIGTQGVVTESIDNLQGAGRIKAGSLYWSARSTDGTSIEKDAVVKVDRVEGVKVFVSKV